MTEQEVAPQAEFGYGQLSGDDWKFVQDARDEIRRLGKQTAESICEIGRLLTEVKARLPHGKWLPWLAAEFAWSETTARRFMDSHELFKSAKLEDLPRLLELPPSAVAEIAAPSTPEPARQEVLARVEQGEKVTTKAVKDIVASHKQAPSKAQRMRRQWDALQKFKREQDLGPERADAFEQRHPELYQPPSPLVSTITEAQELLAELARIAPAAERGDRDALRRISDGGSQLTDLCLRIVELAKGYAPEPPLAPREHEPQELAEALADAMPEAKGNGAERPQMKTYTCVVSGCGTFEGPVQRGRPPKFCPTHRTSAAGRAKARSATAEG
jgi:antitoxin (DNA-binding transcriptional repressor) of toxin-antitoxin stability system